jgi:hypothetical protein
MAAHQRVDRGRDVRRADGGVRRCPPVGRGCGRDVCGRRRRARNRHALEQRVDQCVERDARVHVVAHDDLAAQRLDGHAQVDALA